jgi:ornithine cyclodeaminase
MQIITREQIGALLPQIDLEAAVRRGFIAYSEGRAIVPPVGELVFTEPPGDVHLKYGYIQGDPYYVIKIASGFYANPKRGLPSSDGMMLVFDRETGAPVATLLDGGTLTDARTAAAGALAARVCAPAEIRQIGVIGTGIQARLQLRALATVTPCREVAVWGRTPAHVDRYIQEMALDGWRVAAADRREVVSTSQLVVTTTPSTTPLVMAEWLQPGTHVTAVGCDGPHKQELEAAVFGRADRIVADSLSQCRERGDLAYGLRAGAVRADAIVELGVVAAGRARDPAHATEITVVDLTGVAVQDIYAAVAVMEAAQATVD